MGSSFSLPTDLDNLVTGGSETRPRRGQRDEPPTHPSATDPTKRSVIVVGAGMSGLCAARALANAGWTNVTVLEARDCVGGRTITKEIGDSGVMVDAGAAWIHGDKRNPLCGMCHSYGIEYVPHPEMKTSIASVVDVGDDGTTFTRWTAEEAAKLAPLLAEAVPSFQPGVSAAEGFQKFLEARQDLTADERQRAQFIMERVVSGAAGPMTDLNVHPLATGQTGRLAEGYDQIIDGGYNSLVVKLSEGLGVELNKVVASIEQVPAGEKVRVVCEDKSTYEADFVICSIPLGVLKASAVQFLPPLPEGKTEALSKLKMGGFEKVILVFEEHFYKGWKDMEEFKNNKLIVNADRSKVGSSPYPLWIDISGKTSKPTVVCLYDGAFALDVQGNKNLTDEAIVADALKYFAAGLGKDVNEIPKPVATMCTRWHSDPFSLGAYSYIPVGASGEDMDVLAEPIYDGRVMFCGEHTIKEHNASVHGPVISGLREARRLDKTAHLKKVVPGIIPQ